MYLSTSSHVVISGSSFSNGDAIYGGAIYVLGNADITIKSTSFTNNTANQGAAIHATTYDSFSILDGTEFSGNEASSKVGE